MRALLDGEDVLARYGRILQKLDLPNTRHQVNYVVSHRYQGVNSIGNLPMFASAEKIKEKTFRIRVHYYIKIFESERFVIADQILCSEKYGKFHLEKFSEIKAFLEL